MGLETRVAPSFHECVFAMFGLMENECLLGENGRFSHVSSGFVSNKPRAYMK
jgi:hypothetical protein